MRKERMFAIVFLIMALVAVVTLPQGFAKTKNFGNRPTLTPVPIKSPSKSPIGPHQSGNGVLLQGSSLLSNHLGVLDFATPLVNT